MSPVSSCLERANINKTPFNPFLHKIHSKRANEHRVVWSICTFVKENKNWPKNKIKRKNQNPKINQGKLIESLIVSDLEIICFIICKWAHKRIRLVLRGHNRGEVTTSSLRDTFQWDASRAGLLRTTWVLFFSFLNFPTFFFFFVFLSWVYTIIKGGLRPCTRHLVQLFLS